MKNIKFYSTNLKAEVVDFKSALLKGLAPDKGLYMPEEIPTFTKEEINKFSQMEYYEIAFEVGRKFLHDQIPDADLKALVKDSYNYPTASFKDFAARMMGRLMQYYLKIEKRNLIILVATSGDTGSAIANAFYGLDNINIVVLFPEKEVTNRQRKQMTTLGKNVQIISIDAKFDDCQYLVKDALNLSSANSINIGRLIPQIVYYFYSYAKLRKSEDEKVIFSVPSGNFGDMMGGMFAKRMGLPIKKFIIATNENDEFPKFVNTGNYNKIEPSKNCLSSAMNVGHPSNLSRFIALYDGVMDETGLISKVPDMMRLREDIYSTSITDEETREMIAEAYKKHKLLLEPHGSVGWHPAKFPEQIIDILDFDPKLPPSLEGLEEKEESYDKVLNNYEEFKKYLINNY